MELSSQNPVEAIGNPKGNRKNRNNNSGDDSSLALPGAEGVTAAVPTVSDQDEGKESLKIRIRLNLQAKVKLELEADIKGEIVIGLL